MALSFRGGVHPDDKKDLTNKKAFESITAPATVVIPMQMHVGAPCKPLVSEGNLVKMGQMIGDSNAPVSAPIHASVSGKVIAVEPRLHPNGCMVTSVVIENDFNDTLHESVVPKGSVESLSADELIKIIRQAGIVGLGGAAYPTHAKIQSCLGKVDTLIINGSECEPYITSGHRAMLETPEEIIGGIRVLMKIFRVDNAIIGIESNKLDAVRVFEKVLPQKNSPIKVKVLKPNILKAEKSSSYTPLQRGRYPPENYWRCGLRCIQYRHLRCYPQRCDNWHAANHARSHCHGGAIANPKNLKCRIGTCFSELVAAAGGFKDEPFKLIMGGPMMGTALTDIEIPVIKATNAFLGFLQYDDIYSKEQVCIRCGRCVTACPMNLMPLYMYMYYHKENFQEVLNLNVSDCIECGACSYVCPGRLFLTQTFGVAKIRLNQHNDSDDTKKGAN